MLRHPYGQITPFQTLVSHAVTTYDMRQFKGDRHIYVSLCYFSRTPYHGYVGITQSLCNHHSVVNCLRLDYLAVKKMAGERLQIKKKECKRPINSSQECKTVRKSVIELREQRDCPVAVTELLLFTVKSNRLVGFVAASPWCRMSATHLDNCNVFLNSL